MEELNRGEEKRVESYPIPRPFKWVSTANSWTPPPSGWMKINSDAAYRPAMNRIYIKIICHDEHGIVHVVRIRGVPTTYLPLQAKIDAILRNSTSKLVIHPLICRCLRFLNDSLNDPWGDQGYQ